MYNRPRCSRVLYYQLLPSLTVPYKTVPAVTAGLIEVSILLYFPTPTRNGIYPAYEGAGTRKPLFIELKLRSSIVHCPARLTAAMHRYVACHFIIPNQLANSVVDKCVVGILLQYSVTLVAAASPTQTMTDRHIFDDHSTLVLRSLTGLVKAHPNLSLLPATKTVINADQYVPCLPLSIRFPVLRPR